MEASEGSQILDELTVLTSEGPMQRGGEFQSVSAKARWTGRVMSFWVTAATQSSGLCMSASFKTRSNGKQNVDQKPVHATYKFQVGPL